MFDNKGLPSNIREVDDSVTVIANGGDLTTNMKGHLAGQGDAWHHPCATTNTLSPSNVVKKHRVTFDSTEDGAFVCTSRITQSSSNAATRDHFIMTLKSVIQCH